ncbi:methyltransferase [Polyangium fumosum]|nr:class I SAM-dependent methyltransferase [Polyangium fumosum]
MIRSVSPRPLGELPHSERESSNGYSAYFGLGHSIELLDRPGVFKISPAGLALGAHLLKTVEDRDLEGRFLDIGTGCGALAILLRSIGAADVTASDISATSVALAAENEQLNFPDARIRFVVSDLFSGLKPGSDRYDMIIFNPPGWRTPSPELREELARIRGDIDPSAMFYGDQILMRFLDELPGYLRPDGRAIVGLNSLVGIKSMLHQYKAQHDGAPPLRFRLCERHTFPLLFYSDHWKRISQELRAEFARWRKHHGSAYTVDSQGNLYWSYELVDCQLAGNIYV